MIIQVVILLIIIYSFLNIKLTKNPLNDLNVYMSIPKF